MYEANSGAGGAGRAGLPFLHHFKSLEFIGFHIYLYFILKCNYCAMGQNTFTGPVSLFQAGKLSLKTKKTRTKHSERSFIWRRNTVCLYFIIAERETPTCQMGFFFVKRGSTTNQAHGRLPLQN